MTDLAMRTPAPVETAAAHGEVRRSRSKLWAPVVALRPGEWLKNAFVVAPLVFSGHLLDRRLFASTIAVTIAFCAVSSAGYLINDLFDRELDRQHPVKRSRPIASGALPVPAAIAIAGCLAVSGPLLALAGGLDAVAYVALYAALTFCYTMLLKRLVIIDVMVIAGCFVVRVLAGQAAIDAVKSDWLILCTSALAMLLGFTKRHQEATSELHEGVRTRPVLEQYSMPFLNHMVSIAAGVALICYALYTMNSPIIGSRMVPTAIPVTYGVLRYVYLIYHHRDARSTASILVRDPGIIAAGGVWILLAGFLLYT